MSRKIGVTGETRLAGLIGYPARHSLSPALHNAAYQAMGIDAAYLAFPVMPEHIGIAVRSVRALGLMGLSVTMPHKEAVIPFLDEITPDAERLGAVNTITLDGDRLVGTNTDGAGFVRSLRVDLSFEPAGRRCVVVGAGGAARSIVVALAGAGAADIAIVNRSVERARHAIDLGGGAARIGSVADVDKADLIVNATSVGMEVDGRSDERLPIAVDNVHAGQVVVDIIYHPPVTAFLDQCNARGAITANGLGMLVHQAAIQVQLWTGREPPVDVMRSAIFGL